MKTDIRMVNSVPNNKHKKEKALALKLEPSDNLGFDL